MKKVSTAATKQSSNFSQQKLTIGLDLGDRNSWYCVVNEAVAAMLVGVLAGKDPPEKIAQLSL